ncbi:MAG: hypothetical protein HY815_23870 [Candidatus Riflebacteria bacterium]|nr:hypothetical protein [Candidatus Riflebacteria bacterium]
MPTTRVDLLYRVRRPRPPSTVEWLLCLAVIGPVWIVLAAVSSIARSPVGRAVGDGIDACFTGWFTARRWWQCSRLLRAIERRSGGELISLATTPRSFRWCEKQSLVEVRLEEPGDLRQAVSLEVLVYSPERLIEVSMRGATGRPGPHGGFRCRLEDRDRFEAWYVRTGAATLDSLGRLATRVDAFGSEAHVAGVRLFGPTEPTILLHHALALLGTVPGIHDAVLGPGPTCTPGLEGRSALPS